MITFEWLIGAGIATIGIISTIVIYQHNTTRGILQTKVDKNLCEDRHKKIDEMDKKVDKINDVVIRIETILNGKKRSEKER